MSLIHVVTNKCECVCIGGYVDGCRSPAAAAAVEGRTAGAQGWIRYHRVPGMNLKRHYSPPLAPNQSHKQSLHNHS